MTLNRRGFLAAAAATAIASPARAQPAPAARLIAAARRQIGVTLAYDPAYSRLAYPGGDVPRAIGVCTDVIIRAYRDAMGRDLQALVHTDMQAAFGAYPKRWGLKRPDANIDHRRVANLEVYLTRKGARLPIPRSLIDWRAGDLVSALVGGRLPHIGIVSDRRSPAGHPLLIHNIGQGTREEDALGDHRTIGRFRWLV
jgi:uncharacterized protein YijF (DUF1287 family)